jgi:uncharacterized membrane protein YbaN (DUF454 family)
VEFFKDVYEWFKNLFTDFNAWMKSTFQFDKRITDFYNFAIAPLPEWVKILGLIVVLIALVIGMIQLIKKSFKVMIILLIVFGIIILIIWL